MVIATEEPEGNVKMQVTY